MSAPLCSNTPDYRQVPGFARPEAAPFATTSTRSGERSRKRRGSRTRRFRTGHSRGEAASHSRAICATTLRLSRGRTSAGHGVRLRVGRRRRGALRARARCSPSISTRSRLRRSTSMRARTTCASRRGARPIRFDPPDVDVILAGDCWYEERFGARIVRGLIRAAESGSASLSVTRAAATSPTTDSPSSATYDVRSTTDLEDLGRTTASVYAVDG